MESLNLSQSWPTTTYVRYSQADYARNEGYQVFSGSSKHMQETISGTSHHVSYSCEVHWRVLNSDNYTHNEIPQIGILMKERRLIGQR